MKKKVQAKQINANFDEFKSPIVTSLTKICCDKPQHSSSNNLEKRVSKKKKKNQKLQQNTFRNSSFSSKSLI